MVATPSGWHPDPATRHRLRYWDGARWTDHVSDGNSVSIDPIGMTSASLRRTVYVDAQLQVGFRHRRLLVDDDALWWDDEATRYADVTAVTWWATRVVAGPAHNLDYRLDLWSGKAHRAVKFTGRGDHVRAAFDAASDALHRHVGSRLISEWLSHLDSGESVDVCRWQVSASGARQGKNQMSWGAPLRFDSWSSSGVLFVGVYTRANDKEVRVGDHPIVAPNAVLVEPFLIACKRRYSTPAA